MISEDMCKALHEQLLRERDRLQHEISTVAYGTRSDVFQADEQDGADQHPADDASELFEREKNLTVQRTLEASLQEVHDSLRKFDEGTYGLCETCGQPIPEKRLEAFPAATHCIACQTKLERQAHATGRP